MVIWSVVSSVVALLSLDLVGAKKDITAWAFNQVRMTSMVQSVLSKEQDKLEADFDKELKTKSRAIGQINTSLPKVGLEASAILDLMKGATKEENVKWETGRVSGAVYHGQHKHIELLNAAFGQYSISNPLHPDIWPSVMKFDAEVIAMTADLVNGGVSSVCGSSTSGGTESIILAIKSHRDYYRDYHGIYAPEMVVGNSAHAAVDKACDIMGIRLIKVRLDPLTFKIDIDAMRQAIGPNTILLYASAPSYPHGAIDPVRQMGQLAVRYRIGLHVDCCLGGFVLPFAKKMGYAVPDFDFSVPGVSSMSLDTHKYGFALKGSSVVLYRDKHLRQSQYFCYADWTGGMYTTPTIAGSRSGGIIAQCWASLMAMGEEGYNQHTRDILAVTQFIASGVRGIEGIRLLGLAEAMIVCFDVETKGGLNIYSIGDKMAKKGWSLNSLQNPPCLHICCTVAHVGREHTFLADLKASVEEALANPDASGGNAAIYGMTSALPPGPVNELLKVYNDGTYYTFSTYVHTYLQTHIPAYPIRIYGEWGACNAQLKILNP
ncbi:pyridoxal phosphate-dependent transferase [Ochromonadaceae sp. CCMP2298]|nr:pyridoxal phosphate-dependent transferase [Ochromonadaceae sp. CCMP2298]